MPDGTGGGTAGGAAPDAAGTGHRRYADYLPERTETGVPLPGLPGSAAVRADGPAEPAVFEGLLADANGDPVLHLEQRGGQYGDLVGPLVVRAGRLEAFRSRLPSDAHRLQVHLVADPADDRDGLETVREARNGLFDDDRVEVVGVQLALPASTDPAGTARTLLDALDFTAPAWVELPLDGGWRDALAVVAEDGIERVAVDLAAPPDDLAAFLAAVADVGLPFRVTGLPEVPLAYALHGEAPDPTNGVVNLLCAVRATLAGASPEQVRDVLLSRDEVALSTAVVAMSAAEAVAVRRLLASVDVLDVAAAPMDLWHLGLV